MLLKFMTLVTLLLGSPLFLGTSTTYNYSYYGRAIHSAPGMTFATYATAQTLGTPLASPEDLVVYEDHVYLIDSDTNQLTIIGSDLSLEAALVEFALTESYRLDQGLEVGTLLTLDGPMGVDVTDSGIFIADTNHNRIVKLNHDYEVVATFGEIDDPTFDELAFEPEKITVDPTDRMYVVAKNVYEGILEINANGSFNRFTGVNPIVLTPLEIFRRSLMTEEQLSQLQLYLPTEYTNVDIDERNFIYATSRPSENNAENPIQLINPKGVDVIRRNGYFPPMGDIHYIEGMNNYVIDGPSTLIDIAQTSYGMYTVLDQKRSRLFTYDSEGNLLYINGDEGSQSDKFREGVALDYLGEDLLVLDRSTKTIIVYRLTEFGRYVNEAIMHHHEGRFDEAAEVWEQVIRINTNYEIAYNGIGKMLLREGKYAEAMEYFRLGHDQYYYSKAYREYRNEIIKENFGWIVGGIVLVGGTALGLKIRSVYKKGGSILYED
jgi:tetratricopeptide (TPR) repeat protein